MLQSDAPGRAKVTIQVSDRQQAEKPGFSKDRHESYRAMGKKPGF